MFWEFLRRTMNASIFCKILGHFFYSLNVELKTELEMKETFVEAIVKTEVLLSQNFRQQLSHFADCCRFMVGI